jgi:NADH-quinone oxidoreductase subunit A
VVPATSSDERDALHILAHPVHETQAGVVTEYFQDYITVGAFAALGAILVVGMLGVASLLRPDNPSRAKYLTYECGVDPVGDGWAQTNVRYYLYGLLFVIFDVEAIFIFPWAIKLEDLGVFGLVEMLVFIAILVMGLVYAIRKGVLRWE